MNRFICQTTSRISVVSTRTIQISSSAAVAARYLPRFHRICGASVSAVPSSAVSHHFSSRQFSNNASPPKIQPLTSNNRIQNDNERRSSGSSTRIEPGLLPPPPSGSFFQLILFALVATVAFGAIDYYWQRSGQKARLELRAGLPIDILKLMKEAREATIEGQKEKEKFDIIVRREREKRRRKEIDEERKGGSEIQPATSVSSAESTNDTSPLLTASDDEAFVLLLALTPSLLEAERLYRSILSRLQFRGLDLRKLHEHVALGTTSPEMRSIGESVSESDRRQAKQLIDEMLDYTTTNGVEKVDKRLLPYVLHLLAQVLQIEGNVLKEYDAINGAPSSSPTQQPSTSSSAFRKFSASESYYLQSLTLYRHHFRMDRRPYAVQVMTHLGELFYDMGKLSQAEQVWLRGLDMVEGERRSHGTAKAPQKKQDAILAADEEDPLSSPPPSYSLLASSLAEKLSLVYRTRGEYDRSITWLQDALREWDSHATDFRRHPAVHLPRISSSTASSQLTPPTPHELAIMPLPRAMHLLTALTADLYAAKRVDDALKVSQQSLQVLERIIDLSDAAVRTTDEPSTKDAKAADSLSAAFSSSSPFRRYLEPTFMRRLRFWLDQYTNDASADPTATANRASLDILPAEASACYYNLAILLKSTGQTQEAEESMQIAKQLARIV